MNEYVNFDPQQWANVNDDKQRIHHLVERIEEAGVCLTDDYNDWFSVGSALADGLGEEGRGLFHRLSRMSGKYQPQECDRKYDDCLKNPRRTIHIGTLYHLARQAGIDTGSTGHAPAPTSTYAQSAQFAQMRTETRQEAEKDKYMNTNYLSISNEISAQPNKPAQVAQTAQTAHEAPGKPSMPTFSDRIGREEWCGFLQPLVMAMTDAQDLDKMMLGTLNLLSGAIPNLYGYYGNGEVYPPLYFIVAGPAASRKGELNACRKLLEPLEREIGRDNQRRREAYEQEHAEWEARGGNSHDRSLRGPEPQEPSFRSLFLPVNSTTTAMLMHMKENNGKCILFSTECDDLTNAFKSDYSNYSSYLRTIYHHEEASLIRVKEKLFIAIPKPQMSVLLTSTPGQLPALFPSFENGLGSRFQFYLLHGDMTWRSPFARKEQSLDRLFEEMGQSYMELHRAMEALGERRIQFVLSPAQEQAFDRFFGSLLQEQYGLMGENFASFIFRMGLAAFRIAMVLTLLRRYSEWDHRSSLFQPHEQAVTCCEDDLHITLQMMDVLVTHTMQVFTTLDGDKPRPGGERQGEPDGPQLRLYQALPHRFTTGEMKQVATSIGLNSETARRYLAQLMNRHRLLYRVKNGLYEKTEAEKTAQEEAV